MTSFILEDIRVRRLKISIPDTDIIAHVLVYDNDKIANLYFIDQYERMYIYIDKKPEYEKQLIDIVYTPIAHNTKSITSLNQLLDIILSGIDLYRYSPHINRYEYNMTNKHNLSVSFGFGR